MAISEALKPAVDELEVKLAEHLRQASETKRAINILYGMMGLPPAYEDTQEVVIASSGRLRISPDQYFRKSIAVAAKEYLRAKGEAANVDELIDALKRGGCDLGSVPNRNLRIALSKNSNTFVPISDDVFGLWEKYGGRPRQAKSESGKADEGASETEDSDLQAEAGSTDSAQKAEDPV